MDRTQLLELQRLRSINEFARVNEKRGTGPAIIGSTVTSPAGSTLNDSEETETKEESDDNSSGIIIM